MRLPSSKTSTPPISSAHAKGLRKQALLARAAADRAVFVQACAELGHSKYASGISSLLTQPFLNKFPLKWSMGFQIARMAAPFLFSSYIRTALFRGALKRAWPLIKWGLIGFTAWKGVKLGAKALSSIGDK